MGFLAEMVIVAVLLMYPAWKIFARTGLSPALSLLILVPGIGGFIVLGILAFAEWPVHRYGSGSVDGGGI